MQIPWKLTGFVIQGVLVTIVFAVPMFYPEIIAVTLPKMGVTLEGPTRQKAPAEQAASTTAAVRTTAPTYRPSRVYTAPSRWKNPVQDIIDEPGTFLESISSGPVHAFSTPIHSSTGIGDLAPPPAAAAAAAVPEVSRISVGGSVQEARLLNRVVPQYPAIARQARIQGTVRLAAIIAEDGTVQQLRVVFGHPLLTQAALNAVQQWRYRSTLLNSRPVEVATTIEVNFVLGR